MRMPLRTLRRAAVFGLWAAGAVIVPGYAQSVPAEPATSAVGKFESQFFDKSLLIHDAVFPPRNAVRLFLPVMRHHEQLFRDKTILEIGTGTGVIALYAAKLGAKHVVATDIDPRAIANTNANIKRFGYEHIIETRLVPESTPGAYAVLKPGEMFDIILSNPPYTFDLDNTEPSATLDNGNLGLSIIDGLKTHLKPDGFAMLLYRSYFFQKFINSYAKKQGYSVTEHRSDVLGQKELGVIYSDYWRRALHRHNIDPKSMDVDFFIETPIILPAVQRSNLVPLFKERPGNKRYYPGIMVIRPVP